MATLKCIFGNLQILLKVATPPTSLGEGGDVPPPPLQQPIGVNQKHLYTVLSVEWNSIRLGGHVHVAIYCTQNCAGGIRGFLEHIGVGDPSRPTSLNFFDVTFYQETGYESLGFLQDSIRCYHAKKVFIKTTIKSLPDCTFSMSRTT